MKKNIILFIILIGLFAGGVFLISEINHQKEETSKKTEEREETSKPTIYKNKELNFSLKLPSGYDYQDITDLYRDASKKVNRELVLLVGNTNNKYSDCAKYDPPISQAVEVKVFDNQNMLSAEDWFDEKRNEIKETNSIFLIYENDNPKERFKVRGEEAVEFEKYNDYELRKLVIFAKEDKVYLIEYNPDRSEKISEECKQELDKTLDVILGNFNFIS